jgi:hypothetical protein
MIPYTPVGFRLMMALSAILMLMLRTSAALLGVPGLSRFPMADRLEAGLQI